MAAQISSPFDAGQAGAKEVRAHADELQPSSTLAHAHTRASLLLASGLARTRVRPRIARAQGVKKLVGPLPLTIRNVEAVLDELRPYLMADGGNVAVREIEGPNVYLQLQGACGTCPSSTMTMKMGLERGLKEKIPEIAMVVQVPSEVRLRPARATKRHICASRASPRMLTCPPLAHARAPSVGLLRAGRQRAERGGGRGSARGGAALFADGRRHDRGENAHHHRHRPDRCLADGGRGRRAHVCEGRDPAEAQAQAARARERHVGLRRDAADGIIRRRALAPVI